MATAQSDNSTWTAYKRSAFCGLRHPPGPAPSQLLKMPAGWDVRAGKLHQPENNLCAKRSFSSYSFLSISCAPGEREMRELMYFKRKDECALLSNSGHLFIVEVKVKHDAKKVGKVSCLICCFIAFGQMGKISWAD